MDYIIDNRKIYTLKLMHFIYFRGCLSVRNFYHILKKSNLNFLKIFLIAATGIYFRHLVVSKYLSLVDSKYCDSTQMVLTNLGKDNMGFQKKLIFEEFKDIHLKK